MGLQASSAPAVLQGVPGLFPVQPALLQLMALLCSKWSSSSVQGLSPGGKQGPPGHSNQALQPLEPAGSGCEPVLVLQPPQPLPVPAACTPQMVSAAQSWACLQGFLQGAWGVLGCPGVSWGVLGCPGGSQPQAAPLSPSLCLCRQPWDTPGKCPLPVPPLQQHCVPPWGQQQSAGGTPYPAAFWLQKPRNEVCYASTSFCRRFFSSPMLSCFSESGSVVYLTLSCGHSLHSLCLGSYYTSQSLFTAWLL